MLCTTSFKIQKIEFCVLVSDSWCKQQLFPQNYARLFFDYLSSGDQDDADCFCLSAPFIWVSLK